MNQRIAWVDRMRGLAILSVVVQHLTYCFSNSFVYHKVIGISNMGVFFFISGYIVMQTARIETVSDALRFIRKRTIQLMLPLCAWQLICNKYFFCTGWTLWTRTDLLNVFLEPSLWFLLTLYGYMIAFATFKLFLKNFKSCHRGGVFTLFWISTQVSLALIWKLTGEFHLATLYLPFFASGIGCYQFNKEGLLENKHLASLSFLIVCLVTCFWVSGATSPMNVLYKIMVTFAVIQLTYLLCTNSGWTGVIDGLIQRYGRCSLAIYVLHWSFLSLEPYHPFLPQNEWAALLLTSIFGMIVALVCCWIYDFLRPLPWIRLFLFGQTKFSK